MYREEQHTWPRGLPNLRMNGVIRAVGGTYEHVHVDGVGRIAGDVGVASAARVNGVLTVEGSMDTPELRADGKLNIEGVLKGRMININGIVKAESHVFAESIKISGILKADGNVEAEKVHLQGALKVEGLLNAGEMELGLSHMESRAGEIGGESIRVRRLRGSGWKWLLKWIIPGSETRLVAHVIEGDDIQLEYTHADIVRGQRVIIGKGCKIGRVEYRDQLTRHPDAEIGREERTYG
ncbi:hypothetical protein D3P07_23385 [Paenibacillus sp. 1011MAR3C5]|uniref:hypothetical protein n=1 Tax=Paenibacillus sp. 1011MAR3C5 TaxID=1675787 RepID=UPI000E6C598E|nr:hypothetical protein [Paenibacillus sp. 1011MAR3C5]RJE84312.1 hypothetical protein D3P07_23385 [Paenibacillus sp. 1011MAR3C5]